MYIGRIFHFLHKSSILYQINDLSVLAAMYLIQFMQIEMHLS